MPTIQGSAERLMVLSRPELKQLQMKLDSSGRAIPELSRERSSYLGHLVQIRGQLEIEMVPALFCPLLASWGRCIPGLFYPYGRCG